MKTIIDIYQSRLEDMPKGTACQWFDINTSQWKKMSWFEVHKASNRLAHVLAPRIKKKDRVVVLAQHSPAYLVTTHFLLSVGAIMVPLNPEANFERISHCLNHTQPEFLLYDSGTSKVIIEKLRTLFPSIQFLQLNEWGELDKWADLPIAYRERPAVEITPEDTAFILFTSGTNGLPTPVPMAHGHVVGNLQDIQAVMPAKRQDHFYALQHPSYAFELVVGVLLPMFVGAKLSIAPKQVALDKISSVAPTVLIGTPFVVQRLIDKILSRSHPKMSKPLVNNTLMRVLFSKHLGKSTASVLGTRLRAMVCGGAPASISLIKAARALNFPLVHGYGLTEAGPVVSLNQTQVQDGSVGTVLPGFNYKIADDGELLLKGPSVASLPWFDQTESEEYFGTGDLVTQFNDRIFITGRKDDAFQLQNGAVIHPQSIETQIVGEKIIKHVVITGKNRPSLTAIVFLDREQLELSDMRRVSLDYVKTKIRVAISSLPNAYPIENYIIAEVSAEENEWILPNGKVQRTAVEQFYQNEIDAVYRNVVVKAAS